MNVRCVDCRRYSTDGKLKGQPEMAKQGFGNCAKLKSFEFVSGEIERECEHFVERGQIPASLAGRCANGYE